METMEFIMITMRKEGLNPSFFFFIVGPRLGRMLPLPFRDTRSVLTSGFVFSMRYVVCEVRTLILPFVNLDIMAVRVYFTLFYFFCIESMWSYRG